ncbi:hypothetical protein QJS10_CPB20g00375 [Acorus calamus]|uniref:EF-hand domain-containing protein n=1 Tax=Acorus calamus TaxID=4465 RepID=A0AAV9CA31_ACOCL|nr:hypothetical protein QJS10_CPB20g00375 [Acorus calamus]
MVVSGHDPVQSFLKSLELGLRRTIKDLESHCESLPRLGFSSTNSNGGGIVFGNKKKKVYDEAAAAAAAVADERSRATSSVKKPFFATLFQHNNGRQKSKESRDDRDALCGNCLKFAVSWSLLLNGFAQSFPRSVRRCFQKKPSSKLGRDAAFEEKNEKGNEGLPLDLFFCFMIDNVIQSLQMLDPSPRDTSPSPPPHHHQSMFDMIPGIIMGRKADMGGFLSSMGFARVGGTPPSLVGVASPDSDVKEDGEPAGHGEEADGGSPSKLTIGLLNIPLSNVERLRSTLSTVSLAELIELVPQLGRPSKDYPDKKKLFSVQDFFRYTESEGRRFFEELDRDSDGQVTLEDLEIAMKKRKLPRRYAKDFLRRTRSHLFSKSFGWRQFLSLMEQKEPTILRAYTTLCLSKSGTLQKSQILTSLKSAELPASEENAAAMMRYLNADTEGSISYGHFRNFMLLLPSERLEDDPRSIWFEAATVVAVPPPVAIPAESVLKSALAGGLACALSTSLMHPVDTMKTRVQASTLSFPELVSKLPQIGLQGLYRGSIPAILGQFSSHGLRTGIFEASKLVLINVAPGLPDFQVSGMVQSISSFCSTILGTAVRIPCEVLKQRLQAGIFDNVGEAIVGTLRQDGFKGFFRGTGATLCREVPFYVAGLGLYAEAKKLLFEKRHWYRQNSLQETRVYGHRWQKSKVQEILEDVQATQRLLDRDLEPWETIVVGALSGGLAAVVTTPFDVMKTRMMTAPQGLPVSMSMVAFSILRQEGPLGLFKGAVPRFFWIAPLGAMNFAGYELAKKAMDKREDQLVNDE